MTVNVRVGAEELLYFGGGDVEQHLGALLVVEVQDDPTLLQLTRIQDNKLRGCEQLLHCLLEDAHVRELALVGDAIDDHRNTCRALQVRAAPAWLTARN